MLQSNLTSPLSVILSQQIGLQIAICSEQALLHSESCLGGKREEELIYGEPRNTHMSIY